MPDSSEVRVLKILHVYLSLLDGAATSTQTLWLPWSIHDQLFHWQLGQCAELQSQTRWYSYSHISQSRYSANQYYQFKSIRSDAELKIVYSSFCRFSCQKGLAKLHKLPYFSTWYGTFINKIQIRRGEGETKKNTAAEAVRSWIHVIVGVFVELKSLPWFPLLCRNHMGVLYPGDAVLWSLWASELGPFVWESAFPGDANSLFPFRLKTSQDSGISRLLFNESNLMITVAGYREYYLLSVRSGWTEQDVYLPSSHQNSPSCPVYPQVLLGAEMQGTVTSHTSVNFSCLCPLTQQQCCFSFTDSVCGS